MKQNIPVYWLVDCSGSMIMNQAIQLLNQVLDDSIQTLRHNWANHEQLDIKLNVIKISNEATWHIHNQSLDSVNWVNFDAIGYTATGKALNLVIEDLQSQDDQFAIITHISDGMPTDFELYQEMFKQLQRTQAKRYSIALGEADLDILQEFSGAENTIQLSEVSQMSGIFLSFHDQFFRIILQQLDSQELLTDSVDTNNTVQSSAISNIHDEIELIKQILDDDQLASHYQYNLEKVGLENRNEYIKGKPAKFTKALTQNPFFIVKLNTTNQYFAFINTRVTWIHQFIEEWGLKEWFEIQTNYEKNKKYKLTTLEPAEVSFESDKWRLLKKGTFSAEEKN